MINKNFVLPPKGVSEMETERRLSLLPKVREALDTSTEAIYVGGSLAAGRNHSVHPDSDIDTGLLVTPQTVGHIVGTNLFDKDRAEYFIEGYKKGLAHQFSLDAEMDGVKIECHFIDKDAYLDALRLRKETVLRFRSSNGGQNVNYGFNFNGEELVTELPTETIDKWFTSPFPLYIREGKNFYPCRLVTNLLGTPIIVKGDALLQPYIDSLWTWVAEELLAFAGGEPDLSNTNVSKSMPGNWKFAPETLAAIEERTKTELARL